MHHVRRQRWQITTSDTATAFAVRSALRQRLDELNGGIARGLDDAAPGDAVVHLPSLHVHLKVRDLDELAELLPTALAHAVRDELHENAAAASMVSPAVHRDDALRVYLVTGSLPWPLRSLDTPAVLALLRDAADHWISESGWNGIRLRAPSAIADTFAFFVRMLPLLGEDAQTKLLQSAIDDVSRANDVHHVRLALIGLLEKLAARKTGVAGVRPSIALQLAISAADESDPPALIEAFLVCVENIFDRTTATGLLQQLAKTYRGMTRIITPALRARFTAGNGERPATSAAPGETDALASLPDAKETTEHAADKPFSVREAATAALATRPSPEDEATPGLRVHSAGLVLLHGYLPHLFKACNIDIDTDLARIAPASLRKAAALLHWLACGRDDIHEFELGAIKTLLGCHPNDPVLVTEGLLDETDKSECAALLEAAIGHWPALGSTSADGLRISFLQRHGALTDKQSHWQLLLESESFDVLLAQLPWSISLIKLPWMTKPIFTDWPTR